MSKSYVHTLSYRLSFDEDTLTTIAAHAKAGQMARLSLSAVLLEDGKRLEAAALHCREVARITADTLEARLVTEEMTVKLRLTAAQTGITLAVFDQNEARLTLLLSGTVGTAENAERDAFATVIGREGGGLRSAIGPATARGDNAILDRTRGAAVVMTEGRFGGAPAGLTLGFDFGENAYTLSYEGQELYITLREGMFGELFGIPYAPINKNTTFPTPPAGWMTWYAVKFDASEDVILENAKIMKSKLYDYGADVLWVDWEWQHEALIAKGPDHVDVFHPFTDRYPNGLAYLAKALDGMGLTPALWVGFTHEPGESEFVRKHPETVLRDYLYWYGQYTFDPSHPTWREKYLIPAAKQVPAMGYRALKWDCLPTGLSTCDHCLEGMYGKQGAQEAMHEAVEIVRDIVGPDFYMMSCSGESDRSVLFGADIFDGARIGGDVFSFDAFRTTAKRLCHLYALHNTILYCDPDNVVVRDEFNATEAEKRMRVSLVSLLGLPVTLGDDLRVLPDTDVDYYRRALPTIDAHPRDIRDLSTMGELLTVNLAVARHFGSWNTVGVFNFGEEEKEIELSLSGDLQLADGRYHVYDLWGERYLGIYDSSLKAPLPAHDCLVLRITPVTDHPTVVATSRHISGGVPDLLSVEWCDGHLKGQSHAIGGADYTVTVCGTDAVPHTLTLHPEMTGEIEWSI